MYLPSCMGDARKEGAGQPTTAAAAAQDRAAWPGASAATLPHGESAGLSMGGPKRAAAVQNAASQGAAAAAAEEEELATAKSRWLALSTCSSPASSQLLQVLRRRRHAVVASNLPPPPPGQACASGETGTSATRYIVHNT